MKPNVKDFPICEKCEVFTSSETRTSTARAIFCEGLRATRICPKDIWKKEFEKELREMSNEIHIPFIVKKVRRTLINEILGEGDS